MAAPQYQNPGIQVIESYHHDISPALRDLPLERKDRDEREGRQANLNPQLPLPLHTDIPDPVIEHGLVGLLLPDVMPTPILNFDGIPFPGVGCFCVPPDADGAVGLTQYVQVVNEAYQVFNKTTGASVLGPAALSTIWSGFGGVCQNNSAGDPLVLYDHIANRWLISKFAGGSVPADACIAVSTTSDATGPWNRYAYHLGSNLFTNPKLSVWPDGYYMSTNVFNATFLGPQAFAFDRVKMLSGLPATAITPGITGGPNESPFLPADLDGSILPPAGAPNSFVEFPGAGIYKIWHFHVDFVTPANSTFTLFASPPAASFTLLCPTTQNCVPQLGTAAALDGVGNRLMFRLAYRNFGSPSTPDESIVGNFSVSSGGVAGVRWFELKNVTVGPVTVAQESTYQPDAIWRWLGSAAMDQAGNLAIGFSASSTAINPQIRYAGRLATDPPNTLAQGEAHLFDGTGSSSSGGWDAYSALTVDPVDDCTFWYTNEYYDTTNWRTRIGNFKFAQCDGSATPTPPPSPTPTSTPTPATPTPTIPPTPTPTPTCDAHGDPPCFSLIVNKTDSPDPVQVGHELTYTITVFNNSPFNANSVGMSDTLPAGVSFVSVTPSQGTCTGTSTITCNLGILSQSGTATVTLVVMPTASGTLSNTAFASDNFIPGGSHTQVTTVIPATPTPTPTATLTPTPTPTPSLTPAAQPLNLSTRMRVQTGDKVGIGGFIVTGTAPTHLLLRAIGPSLTQFGVPDALADPVMELHGPAGFITVTNNNWQDDPAQAALIQASGLAPTNDLESAIDATLAPGNYTAVVRGNNNTTGVALVEIYDLNQTSLSKLGNISTRAFVTTGDNIVIAGFILGPPQAGADRIVVRGIGTSLLLVTPALVDPTLELRDGNGAVLVVNNDWQDDPAQAAELIAAGLAPSFAAEAAIAITLPPGPYTALLAGRNNGVGHGLVEIYDRRAP